MLEYKLKRFYKDFSELANDILRIIPTARIYDAYFKVYVEDDANKDFYEKLNIAHLDNKIEFLDKIDIFY